MKDFLAQPISKLLLSVQTLNMGLHCQTIARLSAMPGEVNDDKPIDLNDAAQRSSWREEFSMLARACDEAGFTLSGRMCRSILDRLFSNNAEPIADHDLQLSIVELVGRVTDEMIDRKFLILDSGDTHYYTEEQFDEKVRSVFPDARFDVLEAGRCFALDRWTACVFHLMRIVESGLRQVRKMYGFPECHSWSQYKDKIHAVTETKLGEYKALPDRTVAHALELDKEIRTLQDLWLKVDHVAHRWRNDTIHIDVKYTRAEAKEIFDAIEALMNFLAVQFFSAASTP